jgi:hypothetical protein
MYATEAALSALGADIVSHLDTFRRRRVRRAKTVHARERLYLAQKLAISLRRKATALGVEVWIPFPLSWDFPGEDFHHAAYFRDPFAWLRTRGL